MTIADIQNKINVFYGYAITGLFAPKSQSQWCGQKYGFGGDISG